MEIVQVAKAKQLFVEITVREKRYGLCEGRSLQDLGNVKKRCLTAVSIQILRALPMFSGLNCRLKPLSEGFLP
jgi:hypothetical protein